MNLLSESTNNQKLMLEYEKHQELQLKLQRMQESYEKKLHDLEDDRLRALADMTQFYEAKLQEKVLELGQVRNSYCRTLHFGFPLPFLTWLCPDHTHIIICLIVSCVWD